MPRTWSSFNGWLWCPLPKRLNGNQSFKHVLINQNLRQQKSSFPYIWNLRTQNDPLNVAVGRCLEAVRIHFHRRAAPLQSYQALSWTKWRLIRRIIILVRGTIANLQNYFPLAIDEFEVDQAVALVVSCPDNSTDGFKRRDACIIWTATLEIRHRLLVRQVHIFHFDISSRKPALNQNNIFSRLCDLPKRSAWESPPLVFHSLVEWNAHESI
jgi:hypothetical protein